MTNVHRSAIRYGVFLLIIKDTPLNSSFKSRPKDTRLCEHPCPSLLFSSTFTELKFPEVAYEKGIETHLPFLELVLEFNPSQQLSTTMAHLVPSPSTGWEQTGRVKVRKILMSWDINSLIIKNKSYFKKKKVGKNVGRGRRITTKENKTQDKWCKRKLLTINQPTQSLSSGRPVDHLPVYMLSMTSQYPFPAQIQTTAPY